MSQEVDKYPTVRRLLWIPNPTWPGNLHGQVAADQLGQQQQDPGICCNIIIKTISKGNIKN